MKKLILARRFSQVFFLSLFIYILWSTGRTASLFKIDPLIAILTSISERVIIPGIIFSIAMLPLTFIFGRFFCGWVCPMGSIIDGLGIKAKNRPLNLSRIKYYIFGFIVVLAFFEIQIAWVFDPLVITARFISLNFIPSFTLAMDRAFIFLIKLLNFYAPLYDFYRGLKSSVLGVKIYYFPHSAVTMGFFLVICAFLFITKRFWCRVLCPLGAMYAIIAKFSILRRRVDECGRCMKCKINCRMSAINEDMSYKKEECVLCMDCIYDCPVRGTRFGWPVKAAKEQGKAAISRRDFLFLIASSFLLSGFKNKGASGAGKKLIRPPGVLSEREFLNKCVRCGNCMRVCPTNGLQPVIFESGFSGIWAPHLVPEIGYCEYNCNSCGNVCPTAAIPKFSLARKKEQKLGLAYIDKDICLPWSQNKECIVCEEHCPVSTKAIKTYEEIIGGKKIKKPYVDASLCVGCGICQNKCPTRPERAIKISP
ncbi:MAG: hypothetical protein COS29_04455 [Candidatus Omnitrophica bacterium CG02_land_8_20_14_3_00__42_8]|nr:MAG: hypothetical protein COS29_04455 [Candidatus Omnitrophica bacterium CG02_land_8_20_14_3_00__42_8]